MPFVALPCQEFNLADSEKPQNRVGKLEKK
jgi:hypothetical protein